MIKCHYEIHISKNDTYSMDRPHFHEDIEIVLCIAGEGVFFLEPEVFPLYRGQLFLIDSSITIAAWQMKSTVAGFFIFHQKCCTNFPPFRVIFRREASAPAWSRR